METICEYEKCTGCFACQNVCPHKCIKLVSDKFGELHPQINQDLCIDCGLCILKSATPFPKCYLHKEKWTFDS